MLKLKLQYLGHVIQTVNSLEKTLMLRKTEGRRRMGRRRMRWLDSTIDSVNMNLSRLQEIVKEREAWYTAVHRVRNDLVTEQQSDYITGKASPNSYKNPEN